MSRQKLKREFDLDFGAWVFLLIWQSIEPPTCWKYKPVMYLMIYLRGKEVHLPPARCRKCATSRHSEQNAGGFVAKARTLAGLSSILSRAARWRKLSAYRVRACAAVCDALFARDGLRMSRG